MFFLVSKILEAVSGPFNFAMLIGLAGLVLGLAGCRRWGFGLFGAAFVLLALMAYSPLGALLLRPLEDRFPPPGPNLPAPAGIIVLGGETDEELSAARHLPILAPQAGRLTAGVALSRRFPQARLVFTGGSGSVRQTGNTEAAAVRQLWLALGVPPQQMVFETKSRNTWENALFTKALLQPKPGQIFLLVTSAWHMPRSMGIFRKAGFDVVAYPADYMTFGTDRDYVPVHMVYGNIDMLKNALHEWIGLAAYHLTGKTSAWFPAP